MSVSSTWNSGWLFKIISWIKGPRDPVIRNIHEALIVLDKMASFIDSAKKNLENMYEEHKTRAKAMARSGKKDYEKIFVEELKHIASLISMFSKVHYDLMRVRYRLETITAVEEPMRLLPEIIQELEMIKPEIEKIAPELASMLLEVERRVNSVMSSSDISSVAKMVDNEERVSETTAKLPPLPPTEKPLVEEEVIEYNNVSINTIKKWVLNEIRSNGGFLVVSDFARKYRVPKYMVRLALKKLEDEGLIKSNR